MMADNGGAEDKGDKQHAYTNSDPDKPSDAPIDNSSCAAATLSSISKSENKSAREGSCVITNAIDTPTDKTCVENFTSVSSSDENKLDQGTRPRPDIPEGAGSKPGEVGHVSDSNSKDPVASPTTLLDHKQSSDPISVKAKECGLSEPDTDHSKAEKDGAQLTVTKTDHQIFDGRARNPKPQENVFETPKDNYSKVVYQTVQTDPVDIEIDSLLSECSYNVCDIVTSGAGCEETVKGEKAVWTQTYISGVECFRVVDLAFGEDDASAQHSETNGADNLLSTHAEVHGAVFSSKDRDVEEGENACDKLLGFEPNNKASVSVISEQTNRDEGSEDSLTRTEIDDAKGNIVTDDDSDTGSFIVLRREDAYSVRSSSPSNFDGSEPMLSRVTCGLLGKQTKDKATDETSSVKTSSGLQANVDSMGRKKQSRIAGKASESGQIYGQNPPGGNCSGRQEMQSVAGVQKHSSTESSTMTQADGEKPAHEDPFPDTHSCTLTFQMMYKGDGKSVPEMIACLQYHVPVPFWKWSYFLSEKVNTSLQKFASEVSWNLEGDTVVITSVCPEPKKRKAERCLKAIFEEISTNSKNVKARKHFLDSHAEAIKGKLDAVEELSAPALFSILSEKKQRLLLLSEDPEIISKAEALIKKWNQEKLENEDLQQGQGQVPVCGTSAHSGQSHSKKDVHMPVTAPKELKVHQPSGNNMHQQDCLGQGSNVGRTEATSPLTLQDKTSGATVNTFSAAGAESTAVDRSLKTAEAEFLQQPKVFSDFIQLLNDQRVCINREKLKKESIVSVTNGSTEKMTEVLQRFMYTCTLNVQGNDPEVIDILEQLKKCCGNGFYYQFEAKQDTLVIVCRGEDRDKILPKTEQLVWVEKQVPLPAHVMKYMVISLPVLQKQMQVLIPDSEVNITIESIEDQRPALMVKAERKFFPKVRKVLDKVLGKLWCLQMRTEVELGLSLKPREGEAVVKSTPNKSDVSVHVQVPGHGLLLKAKSPQDHQVLVYEGNILATDCHVIVLPLYEDRKDQSAMHQWILKKELLSMDPARYGASLNPPESFTITLHCQPKAADTRHVVVMHVPPSDSGKFRNYIQLAVQDAMRSAMSLTAGVPTSSIALPLTLGAKGNDWKYVLPAVMEVLTERTEAPVTVKLYLDKSFDNRTVAAETISEVDKYLSNPARNWMTDTFCRVEFPLKSRINIIIGDICTKTVLEQTDVLVNTTDPQLHLTGTGVASKISDAGGVGLKNECRLQYGNIGDHLAAVTGSHGLKPVKEVFHIVLPQDCWNASKEQFLLNSLRARMMSCLLLASSKGHQKITFPTLGTGNLNYPPDKVANVMFATAEYFFALMPHSSVQDVNIVCYFEAKSVIKSFREREKINMASQQSRANDGLSRQSGRGEVMAIVGVCGSELKAVEAVVSKIRMQAPKGEQVQAASGASAEGDSDVDPPGYGGARAKYARKNVETTESSSEEKDLCHFTLPQRLFTMKHLSVLMENHELATLIQKLETVDEPGPSKRFTVPASRLLPVVTEVMKLINQPPEQQRSSQGTKRQGEQQKTMNMPRHNYLALISLMRKEFESMFTVLNEDGDQVTIACKEPSPPQQVIDRMQSLRREEVQIPKEEAMKLGQPFNTVSEGVDAFILPLPDEEKVIIFSFEYNNLSKAKHLVNVRIGKVKVTTRSRRRFDGTGPDSGGSITDQSPPGSLRPTSPFSVPGAVTSEFTTKSGIKVSVYKTDITKLPVDAIVNAANEHLNHGGGVAYAISRAAGFELEEEGDAYIKKHGPLKVTEVGVTSAGSLPCKKVLHAVGPRWADYTDKSYCQGLLIQAVLNCLKTASDHKLASLAVSSISSAIFGVPKHICAESYLTAVKQFEDEQGSNTSLRSIHFVDVSDAMVGVIQDTFKEKWSEATLLSMQSAPHTVSLKTGDKDQQNTEAQGRVVAPKEQSLSTSLYTTSSTYQEAVGAKFVCGDSEASRAVTKMSHDVRHTNVSTGSPSGQGRHSVETLGIYQDTVSPRLGASETNFREQDWNNPTKVSAGLEQTGHPQSSSHGRSQRYSSGQQPRLTENTDKTGTNLQGRFQSQRQMFDTAGDDRKHMPVPKIETVGNGENKQYQFRFPRLDLIFQVQCVENIITDCIVLWQEMGKMFEDRDSQQFLRYTSSQFVQDVLPQLKLQLTGTSEFTYCYQDRLLIFHRLFSRDICSSDKMCRFFENIFAFAEAQGIKTIAVPVISHEILQKEEDYETFAQSIYSVVVRHCIKQSGSVSEVHVICADAPRLSSIAKYVKIAANGDHANEEPYLKSGNSHGRTTGPMQRLETQDLCPVCLDRMMDPMCLEKCGHSFCRCCIDKTFAQKPECPKCRAFYGPIIGIQPKNGKMKMYKKTYSLPGFQKSVETLVIEYEFSPGKQSEEHPFPGMSYKGIERKAYLPNTQEGRKVLMLLKTAFDRRLIFTVGESHTTGEIGITWADIHHKTEKAENKMFGYPDERYLQNVQEELAAKNVTEKDLTDIQKDFIRHPEPVFPRMPISDFSNCFNKKNK